MQMKLCAVARLAGTVENAATVCRDPEAWIRDPQSSDALVNRHMPVCGELKSLWRSSQRADGKWKSNASSTTDRNSKRNTRLEADRLGVSLRLISPSHFGARDDLSTSNGDT